MTRPNAENTRIVRDYLEYLEQGEGRSAATVDAVAAAINRFLVHAKHRNLKKFHREQATAFVRHLKEHRTAKTGEALSMATIQSIVHALKKFLLWLAGQPGYRLNLTFADANYFRLSENEVRVAKAKDRKPVPTIEQINRVLDGLPTETDIEKRNRALIAFTLLTGARDGAVASFQLRDVDLTRRSVFQDARHVRTKRAKSFETTFYPVAGQAEEIFSDWVAFLRQEKLWGESDPLFPSTEIELGEDGGFRPAGLSRSHWSNAGPIRKIFREAFEAAGLPYSSPHTFRKTLTLLGQRICHSAEDFKAWSQNMGHESPLTTFTSYGTLPDERRAEVLQKLGLDKESATDAAELRELAKKILATTGGS